MYSRLRAFLLLSATLPLLACGDVLPTTTAVDLTAGVPSGAVRPVIQSLAGDAPGTVAYVIHIVSRDVPLSAYQGVLTFPPGSFEMVDVVVPAGATGEMRVINRTAVDSGWIRFAAFAPERFAEDVAFTVIVRPLGGGLAVVPQATLQVVGVGEQGKALQSSLLLVSEGVLDLSGQRVVQ